MKDWDYFIWFITNPIFIGLIVLSMVMQPLLKYLRRFYPENMKKTAIESELFVNELQKNEKDSSLVKKVAKIDIMLMMLPALLALAIYSVYIFYNSTSYTPLHLRSGIAYVMAPILFISIGFRSIKKDTILKYFLKDEYERYIILNQKGASIDKLAGFFEKHTVFFGYVFLVIGLATFSAYIFGCSCLEK